MRMPAHGSSLEHVEPDAGARAVRSGEEGSLYRAYLRWMGSGRRGTAGQPGYGGSVPDPIILELRYRAPQNGPDQIVGEADKEDVRRADLARQLNASIYKAAQSFAGDDEETLEVTFFCACGCLTEVKRSLQDYVARGAIVTGHGRPAEYGGR
jgi:hypothetical protein